MNTQHHCNDQPTESVRWERLIEAVQGLSPEFKEAWFQFKNSSDAHPITSSHAKMVTASSHDF
ncbi:MAG: hypothetical protein ACLQAH_13515 [Limisphaerales bacterium]